MVIQQIFLALLLYEYLFLFPVSIEYSGAAKQNSYSGNGGVRG